jgi:predicted AAA+ superfamily ATPase
VFNHSIDDRENALAKHFLRAPSRRLSLHDSPPRLRGNIRPMATSADYSDPEFNRERLVSGAPVGDDNTFELKLRPQRLREFIGQNKVKENLAVAIEAARSRGEAMDHVLLYGPPGLGKTTLANIIANELGVHFQPTAAPLLQIKGDLTAIITNMQDKQVLFIDEIHRLQPVLEELLYSDAYAGGEAVYFCGGDHAGGADFVAAALALWHCAAAGILYAGRFAGDRGALGGDFGRAGG